MTNPTSPLPPVIHSAEKVAYSSIVGQSIMLLNTDGACIGQLSVINTTDTDYVADQVVGAINAHSIQRKEALNELADLGQDYDKPTPPAPLCHPVQVKELEWIALSNSDYVAENELCEFYCYPSNQGNWVLSDGAPGVTRHDSLDQAKAAAQAEFERRILFNLKPAPPTTGRRLM